MAKKGQKFDKYDLDFIEIVLKYHKNSSVTQTAKHFNIPIGTVKTWVHKEKYNLGGRKRGRPLNNEASYKDEVWNFKKVWWLLEGTKKEKVIFIKKNLGKYNLGLMLEVLNLKRSYWDKYKNANLQKTDAKYLKEIQEVFNNNKKQFGYRRITNELHKQGIMINHKRVLKTMQTYGIMAQYARKMQWKAKQNKGIVGKRNSYPDLINRQFNAVNVPLTVLYTDVTYLIFKRSRYYMSTIIDGYTKQIIDFKISKFNDNALVIDNLNSAIRKMKIIKKDLSGIIIHSDHGTQYTSNAFKERCNIDSLIISMGAKYSSADNIVIESFHSLLKKGTIHNNDYSSVFEYVNDVIDWAYWYNNNKKVISVGTDNYVNI